MDNSDVSRQLVGYLKRMTGLLPESMSSLEHTRLIALFFSVIGTDLLCETHGMAAHDLIEWVYSHQITTVSNEKHIHGGFRSILYTDASVGLDKPVATFSLCDHSHVTMVYAALCILVTLGDDLSRIDRSSVLTGIAALQCKDEPGLFSAGLVCPERDIRFVFSAVASSYILNGLDVLDTEAVVEFIGKCLTYEGGFACLPYLETHAGATYCALASLTLLSRLHSFLPVGSRPRERLIRWLSSLQSEGFHGRLYKSDDTCYTFWVCASLQLLGCKHIVNDSGIVQFIARSWDRFSGGIKKFPELLCHSDPLHTHLALSGLSCLKAVAENRCKTSFLDLTACTIPCSEIQQFSDNYTDVRDQFFCLYSEHLGPVQPELNISRRAYVHLQTVRERWQCIKGGSVA